jgi:hypothetical protein
LPLTGALTNSQASYFSRAYRFGLLAPIEEQSTRILAEAGRVCDQTAAVEETCSRSASVETHRERDVLTGRA